MRTNAFFSAIRNNDLVTVASLLDEDLALANARIRGDATLLNEQVWVNKRVVDIPPNDDRDSPALHYAAFNGLLNWQGYCLIIVRTFMRLPTKIITK